jgi:CRISPR/Cas system-associated endonuclease Cas3-HD
MKRGAASSPAVSSATLARCASSVASFASRSSWRAASAALSLFFRNLASAGKKPAVAASVASVAGRSCGDEKKKFRSVVERASERASEVVK